MTNEERVMVIFGKNPITTRPSLTTLKVVKRVDNRLEKKPSISDMNVDGYIPKGNKDLMMLFLDVYRRVL